MRFDRTHAVTEITLTVMNTRVINLVALLLLGPMATVVAQEEDGSQSPSQPGAYTVSGSVTAGYRATDVKGLEGRTSELWAERLFHEQFQYDPSKGIPAFSLDLFAEPVEIDGGIFDELFVNGSYDGANALGTVRMRNHGAYDLRLDYTRSNYFFDRFDSVFSDLRQYDFARDRFTANLKVTPVDMLDVDVQYFTTGRDGNQQIPRSPFLELSSLSSTFQWAGYSRANIYRIDYPLDDRTHRFQGSVTARLPMTSVSAGGGYRTFNETIDGTPNKLTSLNLRGDSANGYVNEFGIVGTSAVKEPLSAFHWQEQRESSGPFAFGQVVFKPIDMLSATATLNYQKIDGEVTVDHMQNGIVRRNSSGSQLKKYRATYGGESTSKNDFTQASINVALQPIDMLHIVGGFEFRRQNQTAHADFRGTLDTMIGSETETFAAVGDSANQFIADTDYKTLTQTITGDIMLAPLPNLSVRGGIRLATRTPDVVRLLEHRFDSAFSNSQSQKTTFTTITGSVFYRPIREIRLRARVTSQVGEAYQAVVTETETTRGENAIDMVPRRTPKKDLRFSGSLDADLIDGLTMSLSASVNNGNNELAAVPGVTTTSRPYELDQGGQSYSGTIAYRFDNVGRFSFSTSYLENDFSVPMTWVRASAGGTLLNPPFGTSPLDSLTILVEEHRIDRVISGAATVEPIAGLSVGAQLNYVRSTGESTMSPDALNPARLPLVKSDATRMNGPLTRWEARGHVGYEILSNVGLAVDALIVNQEEDMVGALVALNNFNASRLTFSLIYRF